MSRVAWPDYFMNIAHLVAERSTCLRRRVGAVAVKDKRILATGYNGAPSKVAHCPDIGCLREQLACLSGQRHETLASTRSRTSSFRPRYTAFPSPGPKSTARISFASSASKNALINCGITQKSGTHRATRTNWLCRC